MIYSNIFPFHADVWGTVSDWAAVIVYGVTGYLIYRTLKSQLKVQELQQKITDIEQNRYRMEVLPKFKIKSYKPQITFNGQQFIMEESVVTLGLNNFKAHSVSVIVSYDDDGWTVEPKNYITDVQLPKTNIVFKVSFKNNKTNFLKEPIFYLSILSLDISYKDEFNNLYNQSHSFAAMKDSFNLTSKPPILIID